MADIFLSYAREDIKKAGMLANALENQGWTVFWDRTSLLAGQDFEAVIHQAIQQAGCMVVAWSQASTQSNWVRGEAGIAGERNVLVPILFEPVEPPIAFRSLHTENLADWDGETDAPDFLKLCKAINERITANTDTGTSPTPSIRLQTRQRERKTQFLKAILQ
ncbi:MAG: toll/interleukin-1 receptor domain-containing protein [Methylococcaceae bacterium]|nr:toll/interleukin-1 receptor domain-containing protein [Methylococcaceae bacterium]